MITLNILFKINKGGMKKYKKFFEEDLWKEAFDLQKEVFKITKKFPTEEKFGLRSQLNNSSNSVMANLAEEHGRFYFGDKVRMLYIVRGEVEETQSHLICAVSRQYVGQKMCSELVEKYEKLKIKLNGRISDFSRKKTK